MKKFLVFMLVVSLFAFTGSALAYTVDADDAAGHYSWLKSLDSLTDEQQAWLDAYEAALSAASTAIESSETLTDDDSGTLSSAVATTVANGSMTTEQAVAVLEAAAASSAAAVDAANSTLETATATAISSYTDPNVGTATVQTIAEAGITVTAADNATLAKALEMVASADEGETVTPIVLPTLTIPDGTTVAAGTVIDLTLYNPTDGTEFTGMKSVKFFGNDGEEVTNGNMWFVYVSNDTVGVISSDTTDISPVQQAGVTVILRFKYTSENNSKIVGMAADETINFTVRLSSNEAGSSSGGSGSGGSGSEEETTNRSLGGSGGGCVAGTSALALAVLGLFIAKRRG